MSLTAQEAPQATKKSKTNILSWLLSVCVDSLFSNGVVHVYFLDSKW